jgi:replication factor A2
LAQRAFEVLYYTPQTFEGLSLEIVSRMMGEETAMVFELIQELLGYGFVYTTVDDYTYAVLDV